MVITDESTQNRSVFSSSPSRLRRREWRKEIRRNSDESLSEISRDNEFHKEYRGKLNTDNSCRNEFRRQSRGKQNTVGRNKKKFTRNITQSVIIHMGSNNFIQMGSTNDSSTKTPTRFRRKKHEKKPPATKSDDKIVDTSSTESTCVLSVSDLSDSSPPVTREPKSVKKTTKKKKPKRKRRKKKKKGCKVSEVQRKKYIALDCEMVGVGENGTESAVARVSLTNWDGNIMLDTFVRVSKPITDLRTAVSGIRLCDLESDEAMCLEDCREVVRDITKDKILVGHGLKNDLRVLGISYPWHQIRDTARYEPFMKDYKLLGYGVFRPRRLKELAYEFLGLEIQQVGTEHDPVVDAWVAMELYKLMRPKWEKVIRWKLKKTNEIEKKLLPEPQEDKLELQEKNQESQEDNPETREDNPET